MITEEKKLKEEITTGITPEVLLNQSRAVLFDCDGTLADVEMAHWAKVTRAVLEKHGITLSESENEQFQIDRQGVGDLGQFIIDRFGSRLSDVKPQDLFQEISLTLQQSYTKNGITPMPGAVELVKDLKNKGFLLAVASSTPLDHVKQTMRDFSIEDCFLVVIAKDNREGKGKPFPDIFLQAARELGVEPKNCVVVEDAISGVTAGKAAGMSVIAVPNPFRTADFKEADVIIHSLQEINLDNIMKISEE